MIFKYKALNDKGEGTDGTIDAINIDVAIAQLQKRGLVISKIDSPENKKLQVKFMAIFNRVSTKDVVILSRQMATLFQAQVSALRIFRLLSEQTENPTLQKYLIDISDDMQGGSSISLALSRHPDAFSDFYVNMVKAGEESGKLDETFNYLADYLDRTYEVTSKAKNALIYPAFVVMTFVGVMALMLTVIIPKIALMIVDSGIEMPFYTKIVLDLSYIILHYGVFIAFGIVILGFIVWKYSKTEEGAMNLDIMRLHIPYIGSLYKKLYLSRVADNLNTMIISGIPILRALEITSAVVGNRLYKSILDRTILEVKGGAALSSDRKSTRLNSSH